MDTDACIAESLCCPPESITTLLAGYTPGQRKSLKKKKKEEEVLKHAERRPGPLFLSLLSAWLL